MAEWIGQLIAGLPGWAIVLVIILIIGISLFVMWSTEVYPFTRKRVYVGEKKNAKK